MEEMALFSDRRIDSSLDLMMSKRWMAERSLCGLPPPCARAAPFKLRNSAAQSAKRAMKRECINRTSEKNILIILDFRSPIADCRSQNLIEVFPCNSKSQIKNP